MISAKSASYGAVAALTLVSGGYSVAIAQGTRGAAPAEAQAGQAPRAPAVRIEKRPYDIKQLVSVPPLAVDAHRGRTIWLQRCAYCHDGVGQPTYKTIGPWLGAETVTTLTEDGVRAFINAGTQDMPGFGYALKPQQVNEVIAFMKTRGADTKPTPLQLADGKAPTGPAAGPGGGPGGGNGD